MLLRFKSFLRPPVIICTEVNPPVSLPALTGGAGISVFNQAEGCVSSASRSPDVSLSSVSTRPAKSEVGLAMLIARPLRLLAWQG